MKTEIKIVRLQKKMVALSEELDALIAEDELNVELDSMEEYMEAAQPVNPHQGYGYVENSPVKPETVDDGAGEFVDHDVTRGVQY